jgi:hypothetical protein
LYASGTMARASDEPMTYVQLDKEAPGLPEIGTVTASFIVGPKPEKKANDGHRSIAVYLLDDNRQRFMGTVGVPDPYRLPKEGEIVEVQYLYCHPGADGNLIQAKYFGKVRDDIKIAECGVSQLKVKANDCDPIEP